MPISFSPAGTFKGASGQANVLNNPTSLQFGPDGRLYVSEQNGSVNAFSVAFQNGEWVATDHELIVDGNGDEVVKSIQNHFDDGTESGLSNRQVTGILVTGTATEPVLYISSSNPDIASNGEKFLDTNSGVVTRASLDSTTGEWDVVDLVRGLPRSEENHAVNGMLLSEDGTKLLLQVGGFTNNGAPSGFFSYTNEYALSASVLELDLIALDALPNQIDSQAGQGNTPRNYKYDLPTLDDPNIPNVTDGVGEDEFGMDEAGPWGGNDGLNMAILPADAPLRLYADGLRNAYDLARTPNGNVFSVDNGSNGGLGGAPATESNDDDGDGIANEAISTPASGSFGEGEPLIKIIEGGYYYHANPVRSNQNQSWTVYNDSGQPDGAVAVNFVEDISARVPDGVNIEEGFLIDPSKFAVGPGQTLADLSESDRSDRLFLSGVTIDSDALEQNDPDGNGLGQQVIEILGSSTNGITAYDSGGQAFGGSIDGALFVTQFNDNITLLNINDAGTDLEPVFAPGPDGIYGNADDVVQDADGVLFVANNSLGVPLANPLDVVQGPDGTLWVAEIGGNEVTVLAPSDFIAGPDTDADNDGIENPNDPFIRDASNGTSVVITPDETFLWDFDPNQDGNLPGPDGFGGGLTGVMINGTTDFEEFFQSPRDPSDPNNSQIKLDNVKFITAAGGGTTVIEEVSNGDPFQGSNSGEFLFHTGVVAAPNVETMSILWTMSNPGDAFTGTFQQIGGYIGTGDQSDYLKVVAIQNNGGELQVTLEEGDAVSQTYLLQADDLFQVAEVDAKKLFIELQIDLVAETATPTITYETLGADKTVVGTAIDLSGSVVLDALRGQYQVEGQTSGLAVGLFSTNVGEPEANTFQAVFQDLEITATEAQVAPIAGDDSVRTQVSQTLTIPVADLLANDTDANSDPLVITAVSNPQNGAVAIDDNGTTGNASDDFITFTPDAGFEGQASFSYTVSDGTASDTADVTVDVSDLSVLFRLNATDETIAALPNDPYGSTLDWIGSGGVGAQSGTQSGLEFSVNIGNITTHDITGRDASVPDYVPQAIFAEERWDPAAAPEMVYSFGNGNLASGTYTVNLFTGNGFGGTSEVGERVFDIEIEGTEVFSDVDLVSLFGHQVGGLLSWTGEVTDGSLDIEWLHQVENPTINGIEILAGAISEPPLTVSIVSGTQTVSEADGSALVSVLTSRTVPSDESVTFTYTIEGVTATPEADYSPNESLVGAGTATFTGNATIAGGSSDFQIPIDILQDTDIEPDETLTVTIVSVSSNAQLGAVTAATITIQDDDENVVTPPNPGDVLYRVNAGGSLVTATDGGPDWTADTGNIGAAGNSPYLAANSTGTSTYNNNAGSSYPGNVESVMGVPSSTPLAVFDTERYDPNAADPKLLWQFDVATDYGLQPGDQVEVRLYFAEIFSGIDTDGERVFDVAVEGITPPEFDDVDPFSDVGSAGNVGSVRTTVATVGADGVLDIEFTHGVENPAVKAIEIIAFGDPAPVDQIDGVTVPGGDLSSDPAAPTAIALPEDGSATVLSTLAGGNSDRDFITVTIPDGQRLADVILDNYTADPSNSGFIGLVAGSDFVLDPAIPPLGTTPDGVVEAGDLLGGYVFNAGDIGTDLIPSLNAPGFAGFDEAALTGDLTFWLNQGGDASEATLTFVTEAVPVLGNGEAVLTINESANDIETSNFGNNSFQITNTGAKDITAIEINVTDALFPDAVFDPFGIAGDTVGKILTINTPGDTGVITPAGGFDEDAIGITYLGTGGIAGFETIRLEFTDFNPGETVGFAVDMDPNSIAGATKSTLDSGAVLAGAGGNNLWDVGGIGGAELIGSAFTVTYEDATTSIGKLQGQGTGQQLGAKALSTQDGQNLTVTLTVNGLGEGAEGTYSVGGPEVLIQGPAGETARVLVAKGFIVPFVNNFAETDPYAAQLDAQLTALEASGFPANNAVELLYVDVPLDGTVQDISSLFDFTQVAAFDLSVPDADNEFGELDEAKLPLGVVASVIDPTTDLSKGTVTSPIHLTFAENEAPVVAPISDVTVDELTEATFSVSATDAEQDAIALSVEITRTSDNTVVDPAEYSFVDNSDGTGSFSWLTNEPDDGVYTATVTASDATGQTTESFTLTVNEVAGPQPGDILFRVNAGGVEVAAIDGGPAWTEDTQQNNSPFLVNAGSNNDFPANGQPTNASLDLSLLDGSVPEAVIGIERWDNITDAAGEMQWAFNVAAETDVEVRLYLAELFTNLPDLDNSGDPTGDRIFDVSVDGVVPAAFDDIDPYTLAGGAFNTASVVTHTVTSDGTVDLEFIHVFENPAIKAIELVVASSDIVPEVNLSVNTTQGTEADTTEVTVTVTASEAVDGDQTVALTLAGLNITSDDFTGDIPATLTIPDSQTTASFTVQVNDDVAIEETETALFSISNPSAGITLGNTTAASVEVVDNDLVLVGAATVSVTLNSNNVQTSNFANNSFLVTNVGDKTIASVEIDVTNALYPDSVFDPFGVAGDTIAKPLTISTLGGTGLVLTGENNGSGQPIFGSGSVGTVYLGAGGSDGFETLKLDFDSNTDGGFEAGETLGFAVDMDPNSIAGASKGTLDSGADPTWDIGGVSGAELIGSEVRFTFTDGTTATGQLQGNNNQGGSQALATQSPAQPAVNLTVNGLDAGGVGTYDATEPSVIINGPAGATARIVLTKGIIQPTENNFTDSFAAQLDTQLAALAASDFPANNAAEFQTVDIVLTGQDQDISDQFDFTQVPGFDLAVNEAELPLGFVAGIIDPDNGDLPTGPVTAPIYLEFERDRVTDQLLALYTFDEGSGSTVTDTSGSGAALNLTIDDVSDVTWGNGTLTLDAATLISSTGPANKLNNGLTATNEITIEAWISPENTSQGGPARIASLSGDIKNRNFTLGQDGNKYDVRLRTTSTKDNGTPSLSTSSGSLSTSLSHVVYTREADGDAFFYLNGQLIETDDVSGTFSNWDDDYQFALGNEFGDSRAWLGTYDLVAIYNQSFDSGEVTQNFLAGPGGSNEVPENTPPIAVNDAFTTNEDTAFAFTVSDLLGNDIDDDGDTLSVTAVNSSSTLGLVNFNAATGAVIYDPNGQFEALNAGESLTDAFTYTISDGQDTASATVVFTVTGVDEDASNTPPVAVDDPFTTDEGTIFNLTVAELLANDTDGDGDTLSVTAVDSASTLGLVNFNVATGAITYNPNGQFEALNDGESATDSFTYAISDGQDTASATVVFTVTGIDEDTSNTPPVAAGDAFVTSENAVLNLTVADLLTNDTDADNDTLSVTAIDTSSTSGLVTFNPATGAIAYNPNGQFNFLEDGETAIDSFAYTVSDGKGGIDTAKVDVTVNGVTTAPSDRVTDQLLALYTFDEGSGSVVTDISGVGTALDLSIDDPGNVTWGDGSLTIDSDTLISSSGPANKLFDGLTGTNEITIEAWITPENKRQSGPARIVALTENKRNHNFILGQVGNDYDVRLRTSSTKKNGTPSLSTDGGALETDLTHVVYTREADGDTFLYLNGELTETGNVGGDFSTWDDDHKFALGSEFGDSSKSWKGTYDLVAIYSQSFDSSEVAQNFLAGADGFQ